MDGKFVRNGVTLAVLHASATIWLFGQLPLSTPRGPNTVERAYQVVLFGMHFPAILAGWLLPHGFELLGLALMFADCALWGFGVAWLVERLRRAVAGDRP